MSGAGWGATLLGAVAAMGWLAGPMPLPPQFHASGQLEREWADTAAHSRRNWPLAERAVPSPGD